MRKLWFGVVSLALILFMLAGCVPTAAPSARPAPEEAAPGAAGEVTLTVWDIWTRPEEMAVIDALHRGVPGGASRRQNRSRGRVAPMT